MAKIEFLFVSAISGTNSTLAEIAVSYDSPLVLTPTFSPWHSNYSLALSYIASFVSITVISFDANAKVIVEGQMVGQSAVQVFLPFDESSITIVAWAEDGVTSTTYFIHTQRPGESCFCIVIVRWIRFYSSKKLKGECSKYDVNSEKLFRFQGSRPSAWQARHYRSSLPLRLPCFLKLQCIRDITLSQPIPNMTINRLPILRHIPLF
jgi:hypothetical protein